MIDISQTVAPKSDQLNADDLIGGPRTIRVTRVAAMKEPDQPIAIYFEGDNGKPYKPGKSMRRVLLRIWGQDGSAYAGRRMTLYRDDAVQFGGVAVGGIRISHMSGISSAMTMALTEKRASRRPFTVKPLPDEQAPKREDDRQSGPKRTLEDVAREKARGGQEIYDEWTARLKPAQAEQLVDIQDDINRLLDEADERRREEAKSDDVFPGDTPATGQAA
ncbi:hypothetical protein MKK88_20550 [Methylobacterium sp. E-005]|uniref:hypothetical protein n=1 Tax=Methylobacterium sp. E-005 TaxID=2836549 RepID=UPI001FBA7EBE|nr:hypothetical protein [Methylobacterium sp. E-005]MCJ2088357.1 hypothetical protein [Methylobacterium sp. E-005]